MKELEKIIEIIKAHIFYNTNKTKYGRFLGEACIEEACKDIAKALGKEGYIKIEVENKKMELDEETLERISQEVSENIVHSAMGHVSHKVENTINIHNYHNNSEKRLKNRIYELVIENLKELINDINTEII